MIRKLLPILGVTFVDIVGFSMLIPMMPYFVTHFGASAFTVGVLMSTFSLCQLIAGPIWGNISDRIGRKKVLMISQVGATIGWGMLAFAPTIPWVFFARIVEGISGGNISITQAYVADVVEPKDRAKAFGLIGAMFGAGMVFGPAGGGILFAKYGFAAPFLAAAALQFLTLLLTQFLLPESLSKDEEETATVGLSAIFTSFSKPQLGRLLWQKLALSLALYGWFAVIALYLQRQLHFTLPDTDFYFSLFAAFNVVVNVFIIGRVSTWLGDRGMSNAGLVLLAVSFLLVPFVHNVAMLAILMAFFALGMALGQNGLTALISNAATAREQGTVLGVGSSLDSLSGILAPPVSTAALGTFGPGYAGAESGFFAVISLIAGIINGRHEERGRRAEQHAEAAATGQ